MVSWYGEAVWTRIGFKGSGSGTTIGSRGEASETVGQLGFLWLAVSGWQLK